MQNFKLWDIVWKLINFNFHSNKFIKLTVALRCLIIICIADDYHLYLLVKIIHTMGMRAFSELNLLITYVETDWKGWDLCIKFIWCENKIFLIYNIHFEILFPVYLYINYIYPKSICRTLLSGDIKKIMVHKS